MGLTPPDPTRCQGEKPSGESPFQLGGRPFKMTRCTDKPTVIVTEKSAGKDGQVGSMSLCDHCLGVFREQQPEVAKGVIVARIER